ncbi:MAG: DEAD/DEAH box helicase family protein [Cellvibrionaceae bacterium]|nr:DEAD/DEAH box helicase family protein [Cellvibrionaceae bacterium]
MSDFATGQRWVVDSEPELGLGIVTEVSPRTVSLFFELGACERQYARKQAPLTRIQFAVDDEITLKNGDTTKVQAVHQQEGLLIYDVGDDNLVVESSIGAQIKLNQPFMRLMTGQVDKPSWFNFRRQLKSSVAKTWHSRLVGLLGVRANIIPHQVYVAWAACERERVRVLLADEVGLGKTIEAGMILSRLLAFERVHRVLIMVPDALQVQWLVEMVRKFQIRPSLYTEGEDFSQGQIHIVGHSHIGELEAQLVNAEFDLVIVDEAHHLAINSPSFECLRLLSNIVDHLLLLTATPEQLGAESHFARLQLLDPSKFRSRDAFLDTEQHYIELNTKLRALPEGRQQLIQRYQLENSASDEELMDQLLDSHGLGRVMFRNVRLAIEGFPKRIAVPHPLLENGWEARFEWLAQWIKQQGSEKILVIVHHLDQVRDCEAYLWEKHGIDVALFHEEQNLIERDKAAAYFASEEQGSQILVCSEIGSEGRNFQFSCHLVCLDLPDHPDVLEQRIGRLDRIGQTRDVHIHIPYTEGSEEAERLDWYHNSLNCIAQLNPAAANIHNEYIKHWPLSQQQKTEAKERCSALQQQILEGRDGLLEMNSCRQPFAEELASRIALFEHDTPMALVETASELFQFHFEAGYEGIYSLIPSDKMLIPALPGIPPEGAEVTFSRATACHREDLLFLTWDSPFILGLWEMLQHSELGCASVALLPSNKLPAGHCLLEATFDVVVQAPVARACLPFITEHAVRVLVLDIGDNDLSQALGDEALQNALKPIQKHLARDVIKTQKAHIPKWFAKAEQFAEAKLQPLLEKSANRANHYFAGEVLRLRRLASLNRQVDAEEIDMLEARQSQIIQAITHRSHLQVSAIRLVVITKP